MDEPQIEQKDEPLELPRVRGQWIGRRVAVRCPYCQELHWHMPGPEDKWQRMADCYRGEYLVVFEDTPAKEA